MHSDSTANTPDEGGTRLLVIEVRGGLYALDSAAVREIVTMPTATRLPGAPPGRVSKRLPDEQPL